jgi:8-oxo-dGTP pyrophosphatase MutT (NUDIX family)
VSSVIRIVAALIRNERGEVLLVRKRGTTAFMQPGGKYEVGESARAALVRELNEELGIVAVESDLDYLGYFEADAANEAGHTVEAEVFSLVVAGSVAPLAEIEELIWHDLDNPGDIEVAPLSLNEIFPLIAR